MKLLPLYGFINDVNSITDEIDEWGEWIISMYVQHRLENQPVFLMDLFRAVVWDEEAYRLVDTHAETFKSIDYTLTLYRDKLTDFDVTNIGLRIYEYDDKNITPCYGID